MLQWQMHANEFRVKLPTKLYVFHISSGDSTARLAWALARAAHPIFFFYKINKGNSFTSSLSIPQLILASKIDSTQSQKSILASTLNAKSIIHYPSQLPLFPDQICTLPTACCISPMKSTTTPLSHCRNIDVDF
jgi:hypothetical protein